MPLLHLCVKNSLCCPENNGVMSVYQTVPICTVSLPLTCGIDRTWPPKCNLDLNHIKTGLESIHVLSHEWCPYNSTAVFFIFIDVLVLTACQVWCAEVLAEEGDHVALGRVEGAWLDCIRMLMGTPQFECVPGKKATVISKNFANKWTITGHSSVIFSPMEVWDLSQFQW